MSFRTPRRLIWRRRRRSSGLIVTALAGSRATVTQRISFQGVSTAGPSAGMWVMPARSMRRGRGRSAHRIRRQRRDETRGKYPFSFGHQFAHHWQPVLPARSYLGSRATARAAPEVIIVTVGVIAERHGDRFRPGPGDHPRLGLILDQLDEPARILELPVLARPQPGPPLPARPPAQRPDTARRPASWGRVLQLATMTAAACAHPSMRITGIGQGSEMAGSEHASRMVPRRGIRDHPARHPWAPSSRRASGTPARRGGG
jgi:hypothetical protein